MRTHPTGHGGTIDADFQCSFAYTPSCFAPGKIFAIHNACKDGRPSEFWVCVRLFRPGLVTPEATYPPTFLFVYLDARHFGLHTGVLGELSRNERHSTRVLRDFMVTQLRAGDWSADKLAEYALQRDLPRIERYRSTIHGWVKGVKTSVKQDTVFERADPVALAAFDPATKPCLMNCGPTRDDPRSWIERRFLCTDCPSIPVQKKHWAVAVMECTDSEEERRRLIGSYDHDELTNAVMVLAQHLASRGGAA